MIHYIENDFLKIGVREQGCELTSVYGKREAYEYLWQGDEAYWTGQSPILFPIAGRLIDDKYTFNGKQYSLPQHGFARRMPFSLYEKTECSLSFILTQTEDTLKNYPFRFRLIITFSIEKNKLTVEHRVENCNEGVMYFSLGAHPAFNCEIGDILTFDEKETLKTPVIDLVRSLRLPELLPVLENERDIVITKDIFNGDALLLQEVKSDYITLRSNNHSRKVRFGIGKALCLGIWSKPGAPYVCIEPWCGINDSTEQKKDFSEKEGIISLQPEESFRYAWDAEFTF